MYGAIQNNSTFFFSSNERWTVGVGLIGSVVGHLTGDTGVPGSIPSTLQSFVSFTYLIVTILFFLQGRS